MRLLAALTLVVPLLAGCTSPVAQQDEDLLLPSTVSATYLLGNGDLLWINLTSGHQFMDADGELRSGLRLVVDLPEDNGYVYDTEVVATADGVALREWHKCFGIDPCKYDMLTWDARGAPLPLGIGLPAYLEGTGTIGRQDAWQERIEWNDDASRASVHDPGFYRYSHWMLNPVGTFQFGSSPWFPDSFRLAPISDHPWGSGELQALEIGPVGVQVSDSYQLRTVLPDQGDWFAGSDTNVMATGFKFGRAMDALNADLGSGLQIDCIRAAQVRAPAYETGPLGTFRRDFMVSEIYFDAGGQRQAKEVVFWMDDGTYEVTGDVAGQQGFEGACAAVAEGRFSWPLSASADAPIDRATPWTSVQVAFGASRGEPAPRVDVSLMPPWIDPSGGFLAYAPFRLQFDHQTGWLRTAQVGPDDVVRLDSQGMA